MDGKEKLLDFMFSIDGLVKYSKPADIVANPETGYPTVPIYFNMKLLTKNVEARKLVVSMMTDLLICEPEAVFAIAYGVEYYSSILAYNYDANLLVVRKESKGYGTFADFNIVGSVNGDEKCIVLVDDLVGTGRTIKKARKNITKFLKSEGICIDKKRFSGISIFSDCDDKLMSEKTGVKLFSLIKMEELLEYGIDREYFTRDEASVYAKRSEQYYKYKI